MQDYTWPTHHKKGHECTQLLVDARITDEARSVVRNMEGYEDEEEVQVAKGLWLEDVVSLTGRNKKSLELKSGN